MSLADAHLDAGLYTSADLAVLIVAAGRGSRAGEGLPKQYRPIAGRPLLAHTVHAVFHALPEAPILCVIHPDDEEFYRQSLHYLDEIGKVRLVPPAFGGTQGKSASVMG